MDPALRLFLGVDGGQSSTTAVVGDAAGRILGRASGEPCNRATTGHGRERLRRVTGKLLGQALGAARLPEGTAFEAACFGMSGGPDDKRGLLSGLVPGASVTVTNDAEAALEGATGGECGVVVIAGTGSIAMARDEGGTTARCGGWGYVFGDEGGAFDIVRGALRAALASEEGWGERTGLGEEFLRAAGCRTANEALHRFYDPDWPRDRVASLAPRVDAVARKGDVPARSVLRGAGKTLAALAARAAQSLPVPMEGPRAYPCGGVFRSVLVRDAFAAGLRSHGLALGQPAHDAAIGALLLAYRSSGLAVSVRRER